MKKLVLSILALSIVFVPLVISAQATDELAPQSKTFLDNPIQRTFSLLDPKRLSIDHSYSFSYMSGSGTSGSVGIYMSRFRYQLAKPLTLRVNLEFAHNPISAFGGQTQSLVNQGIYPSFYLDYQPSSSFHLGIGYERVPGYYNPMSWWRTR